LTGGEPLMRSDLFDIIDSAIAHGLHPCLTTNGLLITEEIAKQFGEREPIWLNVSLDGARASTNDRVRGAGTFERVLEKVRILRRHVPFSLAFTLTSENATEIEDCSRLARDIGAQAAVFRPLYPVGTARRNMQLMPSFEEYSNALNRLSPASVSDADLHAIDPFSPQARGQSRAKVHANNGCGAGNLVASVSVQGDVSPCSFLGPDQNAGNIRQRSFVEIWNDSSGFERIRRLSTAQACESSGSDMFTGGCRARALAFHGDINRPDPWHQEFLEQERSLHPLSNLEVNIH
jgi:radical SAM protein with 4Fe4S-binding SPASM domain